MSMDMFDTSDGHTVTVRVLGGTKIEVRKLNGAEPIATVELSGAETRSILTTKPAQPRTAWFISKGLTIAPLDVDRTADALNFALASLS